jgi:hypothetical protein
MKGFPRCPLCGDVIGQYERLVAISGEGSAWATSLAREPGLGWSHEVLVHGGCVGRLAAGLQAGRFWAIAPGPTAED